MEERIEKRLAQKTIVNAIVKAIREDVPDYFREHSKETNNALPFLRGDFINDNLRRESKSGSLEVLPFRRHSWEGRLIVDRKNNCSYSVVTKNTLLRTLTKQRNSPYYLDSIISVLHSDIIAPGQQLPLFDIAKSDKTSLQQDFDSNFRNLLNAEEGHRHYVIAYDAKGSEIADIEVFLFDKNFNIVDKKSLKEFIQPNIMDLTETMTSSVQRDQEKNEGAKRLVKMRPDLPRRGGLQPKKREIEDEA